MLLVLIPATLALLAAWAAWSLHRMWQAVPRSNADLGGF
jgi:hypothetical protein